jgi:GNAT superfamily N-acetyltransferase
MPLEMHMKMMMGKLGTPQKHFFLARVDGKPVARLGAKVHSVEGHTRLHFGFFECHPKYPEATKSLVNAAHAKYPHLEMMGPFHFRQEDPYVGVLVEGFHKTPYFMMPFNPPEYDTFLKDCGMTTAMDLFTYQLNGEEGLPEIVKTNAIKATKELNLTIRQLDPKNLNRDARIIAGIFNEALSDNWGFEEFLDEQVKEMVTLFKLFIDHRVVAFAQVDGKDIGCLIMIPNYNHLIKPSKGKLGPGLLMRYLTRAKTTNSIRGYALGVLKKYQGHGVGSALTDAMFKIGIPLGYKECEISWILANNNPMNDLAKAMGGKQNKVYRIYSKAPISNATHN